jgi:3-oxoadipate enol-lactonase
VSADRFSYGSGSIAIHQRPGSEDGRTILFVHAFPVNASMWLPQFESMAGKHRLVAPDLRGFGHSDPYDGSLAMAAMADDLAAMIDRLALGRVILVGLSMGGYIALAFAKAHAEKLAGLVLADTRAAADTDEVRKGRYRLMERARKDGATAVADQMLPKLLSANAHASNPDLVARVRSMIESTPVQTIVAALEGMATREDLRPRLGELSVPVLVIVGSEDTVTPSDEAKEMADAIPGARITKLDGVGHLSNLEGPDEFSRLLLEFVDSIPTP